MQYVLLTTVENVYEATFIHDYLDNEGIKCLIINEHMSTLMPNFTGMMGAGVQLLVDQNDLNKAILLLENRNKKEQLTCPKCQSINIKFGIGRKNKVKKIIIIIFTLLFWVPFSNKQTSYYCNACKEEFN
jgi:hypothetical protein